LVNSGTAPAGAVVPLANDVFTYVQSVVLAGANIAQTGVTGITKLVRLLTEHHLSLMHG